MGDQLNEQFGRQLLEQRTSVGMTQEELASASGISRVSIVNIERGRQGVSLSTLYRLADALGLAPNELLPTVTSISEVPKIAIGPATPESERAVSAIMRRAAESTAN